MDFFAAIITTILSFFGANPEVLIEDTIAPIVVEEVAPILASGTIAVVDNLVTSEMPTKDTEAVATATPQEKGQEQVPALKPVSPEADLLPGISSTVLETAPDTRTMLVAGGCFWCVESDLEKLPGVLSAVSGYAGGATNNPTYQNYGSGGHREVVEVTYDANKVSFEDILIVTMKTTDPTDDDGTFNDRGDKYSAAFYYESPEQKATIERLIAEVDERGPYDKPLAIDVEERPAFWPAEDYHQDYYKGTLTQLKYTYYRNASGRNALIEKYWGTNTGPRLPWREETTPTTSTNNQIIMWKDYVKPSAEILKTQLDAVTYKVTQEEGTERAGTSPLDKNWEAGIYVDVLSGEPLFSSKDKFDSGTGWPSFVKPITVAAVTEHEDRHLFSVRTEIRSAIADNHLGHVFTDGPKDRGGLRYCMNGVALRFIPKVEMEAQGYGDFVQYL